MLLEDMRDEELAGLIAAGSTRGQDAFSVLVSRCEPLIHRHAARFKSVPVDAEDLVQEGLLGLYAAAGTYRESGGASFRTYASVCIRNRVTSAARHPAGPETSSLDDEDADEPLETGPDPAQLLVDREQIDKLYGRIRNLLTDLEYHVLMGHLGGYSYEEIAARLTADVKSVDNALQRVRRKLSAGKLFQDSAVP